MTVRPVTSRQNATNEAAIQFVDSPPPGRSAGKGGRPSKWAAKAEQLRANPGRWALLIEGGDTAGSAGLLRRNYGLEVSARKRPDGKFDIYACWPEIVADVAASNREAADSVRGAA